MIPDIGDRTRRALSAGALAGSMLFALFWAFYFTNVIAPENAHGPVARFESAFPFADALLALLLLAAAHGLWRRRPHGLFCMTAAAGMTLYLGVLDLTFYGSLGAYSPPRGDGWIELAVNALCIGGGIAALASCWRIWRKPWRSDSRIAPSWSSERRAA